MKWLILLALAVSQVYAAPVCEPRKFEGTYGFQLSGTTRISGTERAAATIGRLVFDGSGSVSGTSSVNFTGYLLGNPVTGKYEVHTDCSFTWSLQDDSGAYQHFAGSITPDFVRAEFRQTDPGAPSQGVMVRTPQACGLNALANSYSYSISGSTTPMLPGETGHKVSSSGTIQVDANGTVTVQGNGHSTALGGSIQVDSDCMVQMQISVPAGSSDGAELVNLRGVLLNGGKEILAIQTDPGAAVTAKFAVR